MSGSTGPTRRWTLVWIDAREAKVVRWHDGVSAVESMESDVPAHHRSTGHVRHDPAVRHGGGEAQAAAEAQRLEHLARFVERVADRLPTEDDLLILGPGTVRDRLEHRVRDRDRHAARSRSIVCEPSERATDRQLVRRVRLVSGDVPRRRTRHPPAGGSLGF